MTDFLHTSKENPLIMLATHVLPMALIAVLAASSLVACSHSDEGAAPSAKPQPETMEGTTTEEDEATAEPAKDDEQDGTIPETEATSKADTSEDGSMTALDFITIYKSELSEEDIYDLYTIAMETSNDIYMATHNGPEKIENADGVNALINAFNRSLTAVAKKYNVAVEEAMTQGDFESINSMLSNAYVNTPRAQEAAAKAEEYLDNLTSTE